jgi:tight adherence protein C
VFNALPGWVVPAAAAALTAAAVLGTAWLVGGGLRPVPPPAGDFDRRRREQLRKNSSFRLLEPVADWVIARGWFRNPTAEQQVEGELQAAGERLPWRADEYLAVRRLEAVGIGFAGGVLVGAVTANVLAAIVLAGVIGWQLPRVYRGGLVARGKKRLEALSARLPFALDLIGLVMDAGVDFRDALRQAVRESDGHPAGEELGRVLREVEGGAASAAAWAALRGRLNTPDINDLVFAVVQGEQMGTPLARVFRTQADQMRLRRSQASEKKAGEAQVGILFSAMLIMLACLLVLVAPFALNFMNSGGF